MNRKLGNLFVQITRKFSQNNGILVHQQLSGDHNGISSIGFNRPQQRNSFSVELVEKLYKTLDKIAYEDVSRVLIIHSLVPKVFCSGADLKERAEMNEQEVQKFVSKLRGLIHKIYNFPIPVIAALDGVALGGGLEIALASDIRVGASNVKLGLVETKLAIMPGAGGTQLLPRLIEPSVAKELIFTASILDGKQAEKLGLINHLVEQNENNDAAFQKSLSIAEKILPNGPLGIKMAKQAINKGLEVDLSTGLAIEEACYSQLIPTKDRVEGLKAFKEKRSPVYIGC